MCVPVDVLEVAESFEDPKYHKSWVEGQGEMFSPPTS